MDTLKRIFIPRIMPGGGTASERRKLGGGKRRRVIPHCGGEVRPLALKRGVTIGWGTVDGGSGI